MFWYIGGNTRDGEFTAGFAYYQLGLAFSSDGKNFTRLPAAESPNRKEGLVLESKNIFPGLQGATNGIASDPTVVLKNGTFHLWLPSVAVNASGAIMRSGISYATSADGINWQASAKNPLPSLSRPENPLTLNYETHSNPSQYSQPMQKPPLMSLEDK